MISKNQLKEARADIIKTADSMTQTAFNLLRGIQVQTRLIYPVQITSSVDNEENSSGDKVEVLEFKITTIRTLINITKAAGIDFFKT